MHTEHELGETVQARAWYDGTSVWTVLYGTLVPTLQTAPVWSRARYWGVTRTGDGIWQPGFPGFPG